MDKSNLVVEQDDEFHEEESGVTFLELLAIQAMMNPNTNSVIKEEEEEEEFAWSGKLEDLESI